MEHTLLFVDDEQNVLNSLERLFEDEDYEIITASGGNEALQKLDSKKVSLVVSDYRMPVMNGVEFLQQVKAKAPETIRIMLTGFADMEATIDSINKSGVHRYVTKPWNDEELKTIVRDSLMHYELMEENKRLNELISKQNQELKDLNENLERKVEERAQEIQQKNKKLEELYTRLDKSFVETARIILNVLELKEPDLGHHSKRVAALATLIAKELNMSPDEIGDVEIAGILHDIGKIGMPPHIFSKDEGTLAPNEIKILRQHPVLGGICLSSIERLKRVSEMVVSHHEQYAGGGYPYKKKAEDIPLGGRILAVANELDNLITGNIGERRPIAIKEALEDIKSKTISHYDPAVVKGLERCEENITIRKWVDLQKKIPLQALKEGMIIAKDVYSQSGVLLIAKDSVVNSAMIGRIKEYAEIDPLREEISIYSQKEEDGHPRASIIEKLRGALSE